MHARSRTEAHTLDWVLTYRDILVELTIRDRRNQLHQPLLTVAALRLADLARQPAGPRPFQYDSPAMPGDTAQACELIGDAEFVAVFGVPSSPLLIEHIATAGGVIDYGGQENGVNYVENSCIRRTTDAGRALTGQLHLHVDTTTYDTTRGAETAFAADRDGQPHQTPVPAKIGDDTLYSVYGGNDDILTIRTGRVITHITYNNPTKPDTPPAERIHTLTPVAQTIAQRLDRF